MNKKKNEQKELRAPCGHVSAEVAHAAQIESSTEVLKLIKNDALETSPY